MPKMQIVTDEMLSRAGKIAQNASNILEKQNMVTDIFKNMGKNFSGKIPSLMTQHMLAMDKEYTTMNGILTNYKDFLEDSAHNYEWKEEELARFAESLGERGNAAATGTSTSGNAGTSTGNSQNQTHEATNNNTVRDPSPEPTTNTAGGWDASGSWDTVGDSFPTQRPDLNSEYYSGSNPQGKQHALGKEGRHGSDSIDCCFYARARSMERRGVSEYTFPPKVDRSVDAIKAGEGVVCFNTGSGEHYVYVEAYDPNTDTVYFSDANMNGSPQTDGSLKSRSFNDFLNYFPKGSYKYVELQ